MKLIDFGLSDFIRPGKVLIVDQPSSLYMPYMSLQSTFAMLLYCSIV
jgi:hypothetical protein